MLDLFAFVKGIEFFFNLLLDVFCVIVVFQVDPVHVGNQSIRAKHVDEVFNFFKKGLNLGLFLSFASFNTFLLVVIGVKVLLSSLE